MKKIYLFIATVFAINMSAQGTKDTIPASSRDTIGAFGSTTSLRLPNGTANDRFVRGAFIVRADEIGNNTLMVAGERLIKVGFQTADSVGTVPPQVVSVADSLITGTIIIYAKNTTDTVFSPALGGSSWPTLFATMTPIYTGPFIIYPDSIGEIMFTCNGAFTYNGDGIYFAYDYTRSPTSKIVGNTFPSTTTPGTFTASAASWDANNQLTASCFVNRPANPTTATAPAPNLPAAGSAFRPCMRIVHDFVSSKVTTINDNNTYGVFPNPNNGVFKVTAKGEPLTAVNVLDATGKVILSNDASGLNETIDISKFPAGIYFLQVTQAGKNKTTKFTKN
jgi:Secretion system C-terminal sorting domain